MSKKKHIMAGRPPKDDPSKVIGHPERFLVTWPVKEALDQVHDEFMKLGLHARSDALRMGLYLLFKKYDLLTPELEEDPTWKNLRELGLV